MTLPGSSRRQASPRKFKGRLSGAAAADERSEPAIERYRPGAARQDEEQQRGPSEMLDPILGIDEGLDDEGHAEHRQRCKPRREAEQQQHRAGELDRGGERRGDLRRDYRHTVLVAEQHHRALPARDLGQAGIPENRADTDAEQQLQRRHREALEQRHDMSQPEAQRSQPRRGDMIGHDGASAARVKATTAPSRKSAATAAPRSNCSSAASAVAAAAASGRPPAIAWRNAKLGAASERKATSPLRRATSRWTPPAARSIASALSTPGRLSRQMRSTGQGEARKPKDGARRKTSRGASAAGTLASEDG